MQWLTFYFKGIQTSLRFGVARYFLNWREPRSSMEGAWNVRNPSGQGADCLARGSHRPPLPRPPDEMPISLPAKNFRRLFKN